MGVLQNVQLMHFPRQQADGDSRIPVAALGGKICPDHPL
jgi:hypothetical protein